VPRADGELLCNALPLNRRVNVFDRAYFQHSLQNKAFAIGTYQQDRAADKTSVNFSYPIISDEGQVSGVVVVVVSLDWWSQQLSGYQLPSGSIAFISDEQGAVVANFPSEVSVHGDSVEHYQVNVTPEEEYKLDTEIVMGDDGVSRIYTHKTLYTKTVGEHVTVSVGIPVDDALELANKEFVSSLFYFFSFLGVISALAIRGLNNSVVDPLQKISDATAELEKGFLSKKPKSSGAKELTVLGERFERMAAARLTAEENANKRGAELDSVFRALPDIYFKVDETGVILDYRAAAPNDLYVPPEQFLGQKMSNVLPPDLGNVFAKKIAEYCRIKEMITWEYPLEIDGELNHFEARASGITDTQEIILVIRNITKRKHDEESLLIAASVFNNSGECMVVTDSKGCVLDVNPAFIKITGYKKHEVQGHRINLLSSGMHDEKFYEAMWESLNRKGCWEGEIYNKRKNGEIFPEWLIINSIRNEEDNVVQYVALYQDISEQKRATELIWKQAHYDSLTGLPNRNSLIDYLNHEIDRAVRNNDQVAILFLDLDGFKNINDTLGHDVGDKLLKQVAGRLSGHVRSADLIARQGGDEFIIVMGRLSASTAALRLAEELLAACTESFLIEGEPVYLSASIGISFYPQDGGSTAELLKAADQAMYEAKDSGRNCFHCFTQEMQEKALKRMQLTKDLHLAYQLKQFQLYYQPIVSLQSGTITKAEALIRWNHPEQGIVPPAEFIPALEDTKLITRVGGWVLEDGRDSIQQLKEKYGPDFQLSINVSPVQFADTEQGLQKWLKQLRELGVEGNSIVIEITEGLFMESSEENLSTLLNFRDAGIQVALDDFGTGYSSLAYIQQYDIDFLKIDREFVKNLPESEDSQILCESIIAMAHQLGIKVIAEGIETNKQRKALLEMGCDYGQGYFFSKPVPLEEFLNQKRNVTA